MAGTTIRRQPALRRSHPGLFLHIVRSPDPGVVGTIFRLDGSAYTFGRDVKGPGGIADPTMSRVHFGVRPRGGVRTYELEDLGGTNGTFVQGMRVDGRRTLAGGDVVMAGETLFVIEQEPLDGELPAAPDVDGRAASTFLGRSRTAERIRRSLETAATTDAPVLLLGPTGAGKEVAARAIHTASDRSGRFIAVNCAAVPAELAEAEFFGHRKGAFTGADTDRAGHFLEADRGTLFLDEIGELPAGLQAKLLRVLETGRVQPVGAAAEVEVDVRIVAATHVDIADAGVDFRRDLFARIGDWVLGLPPLTSRRADILFLFEHFFQAGDTTKPTERTVEFDAALLLHDWPLNTRELKKLAGRLVRLVPAGATLQVSDLPPSLQERVIAQMDRDGAVTGEGRRASVEVPDEDELKSALEHAGGNIKQLAEERGWHRMQIYRWMRKYDLKAKDFRSTD